MLHRAIVVIAVGGARAVSTPEWADRLFRPSYTDKCQSAGQTVAPVES